MHSNISISFVLCILLLGSIDSLLSKIDPELSNELNQGQRVNVFITFDRGIQPALDRTSEIRKNPSGSDWTRRNQAVVDALRSMSDESQKNVVNILSARSQENKYFKYFKQYWSCNIVFIKEANIDIVKEIAQDANVRHIKKEPVANVPEVVYQKEDDVDIERDDEFKSWGLTKIQVREAWAELGNHGEGVVVGTIDTGVRHTHEALRDNFVGSSYGWFDPFDKTKEPFSNGFHGTHVLGTLVGSKGIGVAPGAKWMTCLSCNATDCPGEALLECMQFMSCPTKPDGSNPDCKKAPRVVSNSWVTAHGVRDFDDQILAWRAQGIIPIFAIGNSGFRCRRTKAPGELPWVVGVGSSSPKDWHFYRSAVGPAASGIIKPDIVAPGFDIFSATDASDSSYERYTGTSMATPHVAGVAALLLVRSPSSTYEELFELITSTAYTNVSLNPGYLEEYCNESSPHLIPNIYFGYGRINAFKALQAQTNLLQIK